MRRDFILPEQDLEFLENSGYSWETVKDVRCNWLILYDLTIPKGYNYEKVNVAFKIDSGYPVAQIDMAYFNPPLQLANGKPIVACDVNQQILGKGWQRWSRHRTGQNPWRPGLDDISTHLHAVVGWIERELSR